MNSRWKRSRVPRPPANVVKLQRLYQASGLTRDKFAKKQKISRSWLDKLLERASRVTRARKTLIPVRVRSGPPPLASISEMTSLEVVLRNGRLLRIPSTFNPEALPRLLDILEG